MRERPPLNIPLDAIVAAVRAHGSALGAARMLGCSDAYVRLRLQAAGLTVREVLERWVDAVPRANDDAVGTY